MTMVEEDDKLDKPSGTSPEAPEKVEPEAVTPEAKSEPEGGTAAAPPASGQDDPEAGIMARLTGADPKKNASATPAAPEPSEAVKADAKVPDAPEKPEDFKLPDSHELAAYQPRTRKRIEQFTSQLKAKDAELGTLKPKAAWADNLIAAAQEAKLEPAKFMGWINLGLDLAKNKANPKVIYDLAIASGYKPETPAPVQVPTVDVDKVTSFVHSLVQDLDLAPEKGKELMTLLTTKPAAPAAPPVAVTPQPAAPRPQPAQPTPEQVYAHNVRIGMQEVQREIASYQADHPATWATLAPEIAKELTAIEAKLPPEVRDDPREWRARYAKAAERVLNRSKPATPQIKPSLRPSTSPPSGGPQPGTEEYEIGLLTGAHSIAKG